VATGVKIALRSGTAGKEHGPTEKWHGPVAGAAAVTEAAECRQMPKTCRQRSRSATASERTIKGRGGRGLSAFHPGIATVTASSSQH
jgi:hypothetical protein